MSNGNQDVKEILKQQPGQQLEFVAKFPILESEILELAKIIASFANSEGGTVVIGVDSETKKISGIDIGVDQAISNIMRIGRENCDPPLIPEVKFSEIELKKVIIINIAKGNKRPYHVEGDCYIRDNRIIHIASYAEIEAMYPARGKTTLYSGDSWPVKGATYDDFDKNKIEDYIRKRTDRLGKEVYASQKQFLQNVGVLVDDNGVLVPSCGGLLMFGKDPQQFLWSSGVNLARFKGTDTGGVIIDQKEMRGTFPEMIDGTEQFIMKHMDLGGKVEGFKRKDIPEYPLAAVRESITNAIVHRDYGVVGASVRIFMFDDRIEIYTPGGLPEPVTVDNLEYTQYSRNRIAVEILLHLGGYMEKLGTGIQRIKKSAKEYDLKEPKFYDTGVDFIVTLFGAKEKIKQLEKVEKIEKVQTRAQDIKPKEPGKVNLEKLRKLEKKHEEESLRRLQKREMKKEKTIKRNKVIATFLIILLVFATIFFMVRKRSNVLKHYQMASRLHSKKQYRSALSYYYKFKKENPGHHLADDALYYAGSCLDFLGEDEKALNTYTKIIKSYPNSGKMPYVHFWIGNIYMRKGDYGKADYYFRYCLKEYPDNSFKLDIYYNRAEIAKRQGKFKGAIYQYNNAIEEQNNVTTGYELYEIGLCYLQMGEIESAVKMFKAVMFNRSSALKWIEEAERKLEEIQEERLIRIMDGAEKDSSIQREVKESADKDSETKEEKAMIGKIKPEVYIEEKSEELDKEKMINILIKEGNVFFEEGNYEAAIEAWRNVLEMDVFNKRAKLGIDEAAAKLAEISVRSKKEEEKRKSEEEVRKPETEVEKSKKTAEIKNKLESKKIAKFHYAKGLEFYIDEGYEEAVGEFQEALKLDPSIKEAEEYINKIKVIINK